MFIRVPLAEDPFSYPVPEIVRAPTRGGLQHPTSMHLPIRGWTNTEHLQLRSRRHRSLLTAFGGPSLLILFLFFYLLLIIIIMIMRESLP